MHNISISETPAPDAVSEKAFMDAEKAIMDARARRAASAVGLIARKSRWHLGYSDNYGGFMLLDDRNRIVAGERFDLSPQAVIDYCRDRRA